MTKEIKGWHVATIFALAFGIIISVNLVLAVSAIRTFPGLEVSNSYVASQTFDEDRAVQLALDWDVSAKLVGNQLTLTITQDSLPIDPKIESATFGRATNVQQDQTPKFEFDGHALHATVRGGSGNWNLRLRARGADGSLFKQRVIVEAPE